MIFYDEEKYVYISNIYHTQNEKIVEGRHTWIIIISLIGNRIDFNYSKTIRRWKVRVVAVKEKVRKCVVLFNWKFN
jgi:hypothetical protein